MLLGFFRSGRGCMRAMKTYSPIRSLFTARSIGLTRDEEIFEELSHHDVETDAKPTESPKFEKALEKRLIHNIEWEDSYKWLARASEQDISTILERENEFTQSVLMKALKKKMETFTEIVTNMDAIENEVIAESGNGLSFFHRIDTETRMPIYLCQKPGHEAQVMIDIPQLVKDYGYAALQVMKISPCQKYVAFSLDRTGTEHYDLYVRNLENGKMKQITENENIQNIEWIDASELAYTVLDSKHRACKVIVTTPEAKSLKTILYEEHDPQFFVDIRLTKDKRYFVLTSSSKSMTEARLFNPTDLSTPGVVVKPRTPGHEYFVDHGKQGFFIATNNGEIKDFMIATAKDIVKDPWIPLFSPREGICTTDMELFEDHIILLESRNGEPTISLFDLKTNEVKDIALPHSVGSIVKGINMDYDSKKFRFSSSSIIEPEITYDYCLESNRLIPINKIELKGTTFRSEDYVIYRLMAPSHDGTLVPITMCHRKRLPLNRRNPVVLEVYGAYGANMDMDFDLAKVALLEKGWVFAFAHVRGGGELGKAWYEGGRLSKKKNSSLDLVSCADFLITHGYTSPKYLGVTAASAGGVAVATAVNLHPDIFGAVVLRSPFLDLLEATSNPEYALTELEHEEWGNPISSKDDFCNLKEICPYETIKPQAYPPTLLRSSTIDFRTPVWQHLRYIAKLREMDENQGNMVFLRCIDGAGHFGEVNHDARVEDASVEYSFFATAFGLKDNLNSPHIEAQIQSQNQNTKDPSK